MLNVDFGFAILCMLQVLYEYTYTRTMLAYALPHVIVCLRNELSDLGSQDISGTCLQSIYTAC